MLILNINFINYLVAIFTSRIAAKLEKIKAVYL